MQPTNSSLQYNDTALSQRGTADIDSTAKIPLSKMEARKAQEMYRFPGSTPERQRVRKTVANTSKDIPGDEMVRQQQISSAVRNAFTQFSQQKGLLTNEEVQAWAQWTLQVGRVIEYLRTEKLDERPQGFLATMFSQRPTLRQLIQEESRLGGTLFGQVAQNHHRQFYCLNYTTWIWYEEQLNAKGEVESSTTTRYEIHQNGILKVQDNAPYYFIEGDELINLTKGIQAYYNKMCREKYRRDPATAKPLAV